MWEAQLQVQREEEAAEKLAKLQVRDGLWTKILHAIRIHVSASS